MGTVRTGAFAITTTTKTAKLDDQGRGSVSFTVTNTSGTNLGTRASVKFDDKSSSGWFKIDGKDERAIQVDGTEEYSVSVVAPPVKLAQGEKATPHWLKLRVVDVTAPEERGNESDQVAFTQPEEHDRPFPWLWLIIPAAVLVLAGIGFAVWKLWPQPAVAAANVTVVQPQPSTSFGTVQVNAASAQVTILLLNTGAKSTTVTTALSGTDAADFTMSSTCAGLPLGQNQACQVVLTFAPKSLGAKSASLTFAVATGNAPKAIPLTGTAQGTASFCATPTSVQIYITDPATANSNSFTVANCGTAPLTISTVSLTGDFHFAISANTCNGVTLAPSKANSCVISVLLNSATDGTWTASVQFTLSDGTQPAVGVYGSRRAKIVTCTQYYCPVKVFQTS